MNIETYAIKHAKNRPGALLPETIEIIASLPADSRILDIGCAEGSTLKWLRDQFPDRFELVGIDLSRIRIQKAREKDIPGAIFYEGNAMDLPIEDGRMNFVIASQVIEHVPDDGKMIREVERVLEPGGRFQIDTVFKKKWAFYIYRSPSGWALDPTHLREYTDIDSLLAKFPSSMKIAGVKSIKSYRRINLIRFLSFLPDLVRVRIPGYFAIFISGEKV